MALEEFESEPEEEEWLEDEATNRGDAINEVKAQWRRTMVQTVIVYPI